MKLLKLVMYIFYNYYSKGGTQRIPYVSALLATVFLIYIHIFQLLIILNKVDLLPMDPGQPKIIRYIKLASFLLPILFVIGFFVKEKDLKGAIYEDEVVRRSGRYLIIYIFLSVLLLFFLMFAFAKEYVEVGPRSSLLSL